MRWNDTLMISFANFESPCTVWWIVVFMLSESKDTIRQMDIKSLIFNEREREDGRDCCDIEIYNMKVHLLHLSFQFVVVVLSKPTVNDNHVICDNSYGDEILCTQSLQHRFIFTLNFYLIFMLLTLVFCSCHFSH